MGNHINFIGSRTRKPLTAQEVNYWKMNLGRVLKVGAEFEFNLPEKDTGTCKGKSFTCPCVSYGIPEFSCWTKCLREKECTELADRSRCAKSLDCKKAACTDCKEYSFQCSSLVCSNHVSACVTCEDFKVNCEACEYRFDPNKNPDSIRQACINKFSPSNSYGIVSKSGVHNITTDGSLLGKKGMEVITTGRRIDYWEFFNMSKNIIDTSVEKGAYSNERCSIHMHVLASYYGKVVGTAGSPSPGGGGPISKSNDRVNELERSIPEIILANLHQLLRRYQNAITWMTSGLDDPKHLTRWEKFRVSILNISAITDSMPAVRDRVIAESGGNKYGWVNYKFCEFDNHGDAKRFHVELRVMDGLLTPSAIAAFACLYYALVIKAVELSRYGVIECGDNDWQESAQIIKEALMNNCADWQEGTKNGRFSDTSNLHKYTDVLVRESFDLISQLKHILIKVGPAYDVLEKLADNPCSIRRCAGQSWVDIEKDLAIKLTEEGKFEYEICKIIDTREANSIQSKQEWLDIVAKILRGNKELAIGQEPLDEIVDKVANYIEERQANGEIVWSDKIGTMMTI